MRIPIVVCLQSVGISDWCLHSTARTFAVGVGLEAEFAASAAVVLAGMGKKVCILVSWKSPEGMPREWDEVVSVVVDL